MGYAVFVCDGPVSASGRQLAVGGVCLGRGLVMCRGAWAVHECVGTW